MRHAARRGRRWFPIATASTLFVVATVLSYIRIPSVARHTVWAEDGTRFVHEYFWYGFDDSLFRPYSGYLQFLPRILTWLALHLGPAPTLAVVLSGLSCAVIGVVSALLFVLSGQFLHSWWLRVLAALVPVLVPNGPMESAGTVANVHTYLLVLCPWLFAFVPRSWWSSAGSAVVAIAVTLTEAQGLLFVPLLLIGIRSPKKWPLVAGALVGLAAQVVATELDPRYQHKSGAVITLWDVFVGYLVQPLSGAWTWDSHRVGTFYAAHGLAPFLAVFVLLAVLVVLAVVFGDWRQRWSVIAMVYGSAAVWAGAVIVSPDPTLEFGSHTAQAFATFSTWRYTTAGALFVLLGIVALADVLVQRRWFRPVALTLVAVVVVSMAANFTVGTTGRDNGPLWSPQIAPLAAKCEAEDPGIFENVDIAPGWSALVPCSYLEGQ